MVRHYLPTERRKTVDEGRQRILEAARAVLHLDDVGAFSLDAVAKRAGVTRMTLYNQFGSKAGLLEELFDLLVERSAFRDASAAFSEPNAAKAFDAFVEILGRFYTDNQPVLAALSTAAGLDPEFDAAMRKRNERRRRGIETLVQRLDKTYKPAVPTAELVNALDSLLTLATFTAIAGPDRTPAQVVAVVRRLVRAVIGAPRPAARRR